MSHIPRVHDELIDAVCRVLAGAADPAKAAAQQAYMRSAMPYRGVPSPALKAALRPVLADPAYRIGDRESWAATVRALWDGAAYREERYAALALVRARPYRAWVAQRESVPLYRHLVESGAWWDYVDQIAADFVGAVLRAHPAPEATRMRQWATDERLWVRRTAILCQLASKADTDRQLLLDCVRPNLAGSRHGHEFFIRKAIGWALRQYAKSGPDAAVWVRAVVAAEGEAMSGLTRREALKHL